MCLRISTVLLLSMLMVGVPEARAGRRFVGTPASEQMHAMAHIIRNQGRAARNYSRARINIEEARSKYIDNQRKWTAVYFEKKAMVESKKSREAAKRREIREKRPAPPPAARLTSSQLDPSTGEITWPSGLMLPKFDKQRAKVESLFAVRARAATTTVAADIRAEVDSMRSALKGELESMAPAEYMAARKFLETVAHEATQQAR